MEALGEQGMDRGRDAGRAATIANMRAAREPVRSSAGRNNSIPASLPKPLPSNDALITQSPTLTNSINSGMRSTVQSGSSGCCLAQESITTRFGKELPT
jgi:hypothetical protein